MGGLCAKRAAVQEDTDSPTDKASHRTSGRRQTAFGRADLEEAINGLRDKERERPKLRNRQNGAAAPIAVVEEERKRERPWIEAKPDPRLGNPPKHVEGEQVAAGWPGWLSAVAGEAIKDWIPRRADSFEKLDKIGQGTYSNVYKARDLDTGKIVALKKVRFDNLEPESVRFMAREIQILRRLDHPNVVKLEGLVTSRMSCSLYLVFEYMEHDLAGLVACPGIKFTEPQVKCYLQQLIEGLKHCHSRGVLHRDIKGSNLLLDNGGILKIADFGLATLFHPDQKNPLTSRVVTLWYRPPELLLGATEYGVAVDLWSTGCILAELLAGKPIMPGRTEVEQLHKIFKLCGSPSEEYWKKSKLPHATIFKPQQPYKRCIAESFKDFPQSALVLLETLLAIEPADRGTAAAALKSEFFTTKPLACDPSSLPKYPPSKEFDAKIRDEEARRQRAGGGRGRGADAARRAGTRDHTSKAAPAPDANAELASSLQKRRISSHGASKSKSEKFNPQQEDSAVGFPFDPPRHVETGGGDRVYAPLAVPTGSNVTGTWGNKQTEEDARTAPPRPVSLSTKSVTISDFKAEGGYGTQPSDVASLSTLVAARNNGSGEFCKGTTSASQQERFGDDGAQNSKHEESEVSEYAKQWVETQPSNVHKGSDAFNQQGPVLRDKAGTLGFTGQSERIHFSGPLLPPSANLEDILGEHERQIQQAVRRARHEKGKGQRSITSSHKAWANGTSEISEAPESGNSYGPTTSSSRLKTAKSHYTGEITKLKESEEGLSSVLENFEEQDT